MKFIYRGQTYKALEPIQLDTDSTKKPQIKLFYRGNTFDYDPPVMIPVDTTDWPTATLIYRGNVYERKIKPPKPYQKPHAINWRWRFAGL